MTPISAYGDSQPTSNGRDRETKKAITLLNRVPLRILAVVCVVFALTPPLVAYATNYTYASSIDGWGGYWHSGYNSYTLNEVWHSTLATWEVYYAQSGGGIVGDVQNNNNPTQWPYSISYADSWCHNVSDNTGVTWTCQYGK